MRWLILLLWLPVVAVADEFPALFDVTGVAADDVLNLRAGPGTGHRIVGALGPSARDIEVTRKDASGKWGRVNLPEATGWASLRYLARQVPAGYALTRILQCVGTEPFWTLRIEQGHTARFTAPGWPDREFGIGLLQGAEGRPDRYALRGPGLAVVIRRTECSDGMSDRIYGLDADMLLSGPQTRYLSGCCSLISD